jgi:hypothetical protein
MAWTYSGSPSSSPLDEVRFLIGDTNVDDQLLANDEIAYLLSQNGADVYAAAIGGVRGLIAKAARQVETSRQVGDLTLTVKAGDRIAQYESLLVSLTAEQQSRRGVGVPVMAAAVTQFAIGGMDNESQ